MNKKELVSFICAADQLDLNKKQGEMVVTSFLDAIKHGLLTDGSVQFTGFGTFKVNSRAARDGINPATGESIKIAASKNVSFKTGKTLKDAVNVKKAAAKKAPAKKAAKKKK